MEAIDTAEPQEGKPFGEVAVRLGYCSSEDVRAALNRQHEMRNEDGKDQLIGMILLQEGVLTSDQLISVLRVLEHKHQKDLPESI